MSKEKSKINTEANEKLKTQIDASIGVTRSLIESWLPAPKEGEKLENDDEDDDIMTKYSTGRPDRLGLGAKFLSHADAMRHNNNQPSSTKEEMMLRNKILNQNRRANGESNNKRGKQDDSESDEEESRTSVSKKKKTPNTNQNNNQSNGKKKIGNQGDFLSMYLSERAGKKKGKKK